jgi:DNA-directed RNA polymerase subunit RPC12/RpoP
MWRCSNCGTGVEDKYAHCWQCGSPNVVEQRMQAVETEQKVRVEPSKVESSRVESKSTPAFASYEELAHVPSRPMWFLRRGPLQRGFWFLLAIIIIKVGAWPFLGKYGVYIVAGIAVIALIAILWGFFHRDPSEGVGIKLN